MRNTLDRIQHLNSTIKLTTNKPPKPPLSDSLVLKSRTAVQIPAKGAPNRMVQWPVEKDVAPFVPEVDDLDTVYCNDITDDDGEEQVDADDFCDQPDSSSYPTVPDASQCPDTTNVCTPSVKHWIKETNKCRITSDHPFLHPTGAQRTSEQTIHQQPYALDQSLDILQQWRLRRKMETALIHTNTSSYPMYPYSWTSCFTPQQVDPGRLRRAACDSPRYDNTLVTASCYPPFHLTFCHSATQTEVTGNQMCVTVDTQTEQILEDVENTRLRSTGTMTDAFGGPNHGGDRAVCRPEQRSVRVMALPSQRHAKLQTHWDKRVHPAVDETHGRRHQLQHLPFTPTTHDSIDNDAVTEDDSWQWTLVSSNLSRSSSHSSVDLAQPGPTVLPQNHALLQRMPLANPASNVTTCTNGKHCPDATPSASLGAAASEASIEANIAHYLEQTLEINQLVEQWPNDTVIRDLSSRRFQCLEKLKTVIAEIRLRELKLLDDACVSSSSNLRPQQMRTTHMSVSS